MAADNAPPTPPGVGEAELIGGAGEGAAYRALLRNPRFRNLFGAMLTSSLGDWIGVLAILALTENILGATRATAFALSGVMIARVLPTLFLGPVAGVFVDRWDRKRVMIFTDLGRGLVMASLAFAVDVVHLVVGTLVIEVLSTMFVPAKDATLPNLVRKERLVQANQISLMSTYGTLPIGGALFALLVASAVLFPESWTLVQDRPAVVAIWFNAATFFASAAFISRIDVPHRRVIRRTQDHPPGAGAELVEGLKFIRNHRLIRSLIAGVMAAFLAAGIVIAIAKLFATVLNAGPSGFGFLVAAVGTGLLGGLIASGPLSRRVATERLFAPGIATAGLALMALATMPRLGIALLPAALMGAGAGVGFISGYTLLQEHAEDALRGRTFAAFNTGVRGALFAALVIGPFLVGVIGPETANPITGAYDYGIGGVRVTMMLGGLFAFGGALWTGRSVKQVLRDMAAGLPVDGQPRRPARQGVFIVFEGGEGAGKSTQIRLLEEAIEKAGFEVLVTREPGGTDLAEDLRSLVLDPRRVVDARAEALIYAAARAQHVAEVITPALDRGVVVLCDRFIDSSVVYQGVARDLGAEFIENLSRWATRGVLPDRVVLLDVDPKVGLGRVGEHHDRLESEGIDFHRMVNDAYRARAAADPLRYLTIDATLETHLIAQRIRKMVLDLVEEHTATLDLVHLEPAVEAGETEGLG